jgi:two-component system, NtrC family, response regulator GlrR
LPGGDDETAARAAGGDEVADVAALRLEVVAGADAGRTYEVTGERVVIGTHESADVRLADRAVSRFHCELVRADGRLILRDLGSTNGTFVAGLAVREVFLPPGAMIGLGDSRVMVEVSAAPGRVDRSSHGRFGRLLGRSAAMQRVFAQLERAAARDATVLLTGETGTGKEVAAESLHRESARRGGPFVVVDCGAIPAELLESELFGHERGAFTGAVRSHEGAFAAAAGGTIFLDEIGELPRELQPKLLRVLSRRAVKPVGGEAYAEIDIRVIAATNRDLRREVNADRFRGDLYFRLAVVEIQLPPLRERLDDLPLLIEATLDELKASAAERRWLLDPAFLAQLGRGTWPGNVRELRNTIERALALGGLPDGPDTPDTPGDVPRVDIARPYKEARDEWLATFERGYLTSLLDAHGGNIRAAARAAGIDRVYFYRLLARHGLRRRAQ